MAIMYPENFDSDQPESSAEVYLFHEFKRQLDDSFHVFHSVTWTGNRNLRGECDFVIFKKDVGFITLEAKGGSIEVIDNTWYSINRFDQHVRIKDPVRQARYAQYAFKDLFYNRFQTHFTGVWTWGVCFPETRIEGRYLHRDLNMFNVLHAGNIDRIYDWIMKLFTYTRPGGFRRMGAEEGDRFLSLFNVNTTFARSMLFAVKKQQEELEAVDQFQEYLLNLFDDKKRVAFQGAAGTGKTWLALKKVMRLSEEGKKILFLCFSNNLKEYIARKLSGIPGVTVESFHSFAMSVLSEFIQAIVAEERKENVFWMLTRKLYVRAHESEFCDPSAGIQGFLRWLSTLPCGTDFSREISSFAETFDDTLAQVLKALLPVCGENTGFFSDRLPAALKFIFDEFSLRIQFDAIVIDEAQDFEDKWCDCINYFFRNQADRTIYIFYDDNQSIFQENKKLPVVNLLATPFLADHIFHLKNNMRNTSSIHQFAIMKTGLGSTAKPMEITGLPPEEVSFDKSDNAIEYVSKMVQSLVKQHGIPRGSITLLSNAPYERSVLAGVQELGGFRLDYEASVEGKGIRFRTVSQFKGLESDCVILLLDYGAKILEKHHIITPELVYVGCTRARYILYVVNLSKAAGEQDQPLPDSRMLKAV